MVTVWGAAELLASIFFSCIYELMMLYLLLFPVVVHYGSLLFMLGHQQRNRLGKEGSYSSVVGGIDWQSKS